MKALKQYIGRLVVGIIRYLSRRAKIDLIPLAYSENGITKSYSYQASGEIFFISSFLKSRIKKTHPVFIDVGANKGDYSDLLLKSFPHSKIFSIEPNPHTFSLLKERLSDKINVFQLGVGKTNDTLNLYFNQDDKTSVQATSDPEILKTISKTEVLECISVSIETLDNFCEKNTIDEIDLLKIDVEGFELEVLMGAKKLLENCKIEIIQFEFNEVNIVKRRFLKDFYEILPDYEFFRLDENRLIPLNHWQPKHEIFMFQNILAIRKNESGS